MKRALLTLLLACGCQPKAEQDAVPQAAQSQTAMQRDLDRICSAEQLSGALELQPCERAMHVGIWLAKNIESQDGRELSARLAKLPPAERVTHLQETLAEHKVSSACQIVSTWGD